MIAEEGPRLPARVSRWAPPARPKAKAALATRGTRRTRLSIIIPAVNNGEESSRAVVEKVRSVDALGLQVETLVVDDRSTDATRAVLESLRRVPAVFRARNLGKGAGIQSAIRPATGGVFVIRDSSAAPPPAASAGGESPKLRRVCTRPAEHVVTEIVHLHRTCGVMGFMLNDDDPNANPKLPEVMRLIRRASGL